MLTQQRRLRHQLFVGRAAELGLVQSALAGQGEARVFLLHGAGGLGKTSLLLEIAHRTPDALYLDARDLEPTPESVERAVLGGGARLVLVDSSERLGALDGWIRESLLARLPDGVVLVMAGRAAPTPEWRALAGWGHLIEEIAIGGLSDEEGRALLERLEVPAHRAGEIVDFTHGHPLALWLCADTIVRAPDLALDPRPIDIVQTLVRTLVSQVPGPQHRAALEAATVARVVSEPVLSGLLGSDIDAHELFGWLASLPITQPVSSGLMLHDLARDVLEADLRWRNADRWATLNQRAQAYYSARLAQVPRAEQRPIALDNLFLYRHLPGFGEADWDAAENLRVELALPRDRPSLARLIARHEGEASARIAEQWMEAQPNNVYLFRDGTPEPAGVLMLVALEKATPNEIAADPCTATAAAALNELGPLRPGESALVGRYGMDRDAYQSGGSPVFMRGWALTYRIMATTPGLRYMFGASGDPDAMAPLMALMGAGRDADYHVGERRYGMFHMDFRVLSGFATLFQFLPRASDAAGPTPPAPAPVPTRLDRAEFAEAVRAALKDLHQPAVLGENLLCDSRLTWLSAGLDAERPARVSALRSLLAEAIAALEASPGGARTGPVLRRTYLEPAPVQKQAADALGLSWGSYRRHLTDGITQVVEVLWQREID